MPRRLIVTGANGAGKSRFAAHLAEHWPAVPVVGYDALKLTTQWVQRPKEDSLRLLSRRLAEPEWIVEGGPSLLPLALPRATQVVWLDPAVWVRLKRLGLRPWHHRGRTRPELPPGNVDRVLPQYRFAMNSLRANAAFRRVIKDALAGQDHLRQWHCRTNAEVEQAMADLAKLNR